MRIVAGRWRGRVIEAPADARTRPTSDRVREAWMSIVQPRLPEAEVLDLFAGSGALGLEALSRGARRAQFVEVSARGVRAIERNAERLGALEQVDIWRGDAFRFIARLAASSYDVAFADPPYRAGMAERLTRAWLTRPFARFLGVEHAVGEAVAEGGDTRRYGDTCITFYELA
jgi:16S rRNA (guanine966-N2)-methyltransferase